jgi:hypothetical protein
MAGRSGFSRDIRKPGIGPSQPFEFAIEIAKQVVFIALRPLFVTSKLAC